MKIVDIEKVCKNGMEIIRTDIENKEKKVERVFLGTDDAQFAVDRKLWLTPEAYLDLFGVYGKMVDKYYTEWEIAEDEEAEFYLDNYPGEIECFPLGIKIAYGDILWQPFRTIENKIFFIPEKWIASVDFEDGMTLLYVRENFLAIKKGLYLEGLIKIPLPVFEDRLDEMITNLIKLANAIKTKE